MRAAWAPALTTDSGTPMLVNVDRARSPTLPRIPGAPVTPRARPPPELRTTSLQSMPESGGSPASDRVAGRNSSVTGSTKLSHGLTVIEPASNFRRGQGSLPSIRLDHVVDACVARRHRAHTKNYRYDRAKP